jgi:nucleotide-binding universal stress UspA family protein
MFKKILVPLDGSKLAECALDYAEELAKNCSATELVLVSVTEKVMAKTKAPEIKEMYSSSGEDRIGGSLPGTSMLRGAVTNPGDVASLRPYFGGSSGEDMIIDGSRGSTIILGKLEKQAFNYLNKIAKKLRAKGISTGVEVLIGNPAEKITKFAEEGNFEVIVMSSHGRSGPSRWALGSVTDKIFRGSCIPVLMIKAPGCFPGL